MEKRIIELRLSTARSEVLSHFADGQTEAKEAYFSPKSHN